MIFHLAHIYVLVLDIEGLSLFFPSALWSLTADWWVQWCIDAEALFPPDEWWRNCTNCIDGNTEPVWSFVPAILINMNEHTISKKPFCESGAGVGKLIRSQKMHIG